MKHMMLTLLLSLSAGALFPQEDDAALASISYELIHVADTNNREQPRKEEVIVYLGHYTSLYKSLTLAKRVEELWKHMKEIGFTQGAKDPVSSIRISSANLGTEQLILQPRAERLVLLDKIGDTEYRVDLKFPRIDWVIGNETKEIGGYLCQQATGDFGGREYTAWFSPDLPFAVGPWKLHGLPGLILEAQDSKNEVFFKFLDFGKLADLAITVSLPPAAIETNAKEFQRAKQAFAQNPRIGRTTGPGAVIKRLVVEKDGVRREVSADEASAARGKVQQENELKNNNPLELL